jgi:hypothetical protein
MEDPSADHIPLVEDPVLDPEAVHSARLKEISRMVEWDVFEPILKRDRDPTAKVLTLTWVDREKMKKNVEIAVAFVQESLQPPNVWIPLLRHLQRAVVG